LATSELVQLTLTVVFRTNDMFIFHSMFHIKIYLGHKAKIENEASASRDRGHKIWPRGRIGLDDLTSLFFAQDPTLKLKVTRPRGGLQPGSVT